MNETLVFRHSVDAFYERFEVKEQIGVGAFAVVHRGFDRTTIEQVAIKEVDLSKYCTTDTSLEREIFILSEVQHENIIQLLCAYVTPLKVFIVTELASGGELLERVVENGNFSEADARSVIYQVLKGMKYLHSKNIVHRDLKLENILLSDGSSSAVVKIADFGLARFFSHDSELRTICGSPLYVAPEILDMDANVDTYTPAVDMWSIGVMLYILLSGSTPFDNEDEQSLFQMIRLGDYAMEDHIWDHVSDEAKDCVHRLLTVNTSARMTITEALQNHWVLGLTKAMELPDTVSTIKRTRLTGHLESFRMRQDELRLALQNSNNP
jgi:serine/threonine protein kinase